jgi:Tol biopolymer transport system component
VERVTDGAGYDSQPSFTANWRALLFSSDRAGATTDVFRWDLEDGALVNLTLTPDENEFSPQPWARTGSPSCSRRECPIRTCGSGRTPVVSGSGS